MVTRAITWMLATLWIGAGAAGFGAASPPSVEAPPPREARGQNSDCFDCPTDALYCNAERYICTCDVTGDYFRAGECPAPGGADPSPPDDCPPIHWWCNSSGDCRCAI
jgi:hypothetical protein